MMKMLRNMPLLQLYTTGRKSGKSRQTELIFLHFKEKYVVTASNSGRDQHPSWFYNLEAITQAEIEIDGPKIKVEAKIATPEEKAQIWPLLVEKAPFYDEYRKQTTRDIPLVLLSPIE
ncbi:MAG: nitroreductase/quinone reductase family protein [Candidatus Hodarchaeales archaeon]